VPVVAGPLLGVGEEAINAGGVQCALCVVVPAQRRDITRRALHLRGWRSFGLELSGAYDHRVECLLYLQNRWCRVLSLRLCGVC
jgi:hypothetical protein